MSSGLGIGDAIAVLGLFERVAFELRNYKDAPAHFQQLRAEIDLLLGTFRHVLRITPETAADRVTLEHVKAIVLHCMQPLQEVVNKMRLKEASLGHFRTTRGLSSIGTRLHWSLICQGDVEELRKAIVSQMVAINTLLSVQQLSRLREYLALLRATGDCQAVLVNMRCDALMGQTSKILSLVAATPAAIANYQSSIETQAKKTIEATNSIDQKLTLTTRELKGLSIQVMHVTTGTKRVQSAIDDATQVFSNMIRDISKFFKLLSTHYKEMLEKVSRNTAMLLDIAGQLKRITCAIETIPLHLSLDIVRFDDALGESWALPYQACQTWGAFIDVVRSVVFMKNESGSGRAPFDQPFVIFADSGTRLPDVPKPGLHTKQLTITRKASDATRCPFLDCKGMFSLGAPNEHRRKCSICNRIAVIEPLQSISQNPKWSLTGQIVAPGWASVPRTAICRIDVFATNENLCLFRLVRFTMEANLPEPKKKRFDHPASMRYRSDDTLVDFATVQDADERISCFTQAAMENMAFSTRSAPYDRLYFLDRTHMSLIDLVLLYKDLPGALD